MARFLSLDEAEHMGKIIARDWCKFALAKVNEGKSPARLSAQLPSFISGEFEKPHYAHVEKVSRAKVELISSTAMSRAMEIIRNYPEYAPVLAHFAQRTKDEQTAAKHKHK